jgi:hypothetical protein
VKDTLLDLILEIKSHPISSPIAVTLEKRKMDRAEASLVGSSLQFFETHKSACISHERTPILVNSCRSCTFLRGRPSGKSALVYPA